MKKRAKLTLASSEPAEEKEVAGFETPDETSDRGAETSGPARPGDDRHGGLRKQAGVLRNWPVMGAFVALGAAAVALYLLTRNAPRN